MDLRRQEKKLASLQETRAQKAAEIEKIWERETKEDRDLNEDERNEVLALTKAMETLKEEEKEVEANIDLAKEVQETSKSLGSFSDFSQVQVVNPTPEEIKSAGEQFIESKGYKSLMERGLSGAQWSTGGVDLDTKAVLYETVGSVLSPKEYSPGIVQTLFQRNYVSDALGQQTTTASQIAYVQETTATNAAAAVAEGQAKPQSTFVFGEVTETVRKIATLLPISDETLADAPQIQAYINQRLALFIKNTEENQVLTGSGTAPNIAGIISPGARTIGTFTRSAGTSNERALFMAMNGTRGSSQLDPDLIVVHPTNWQTMRLGTDSAGQYLLGGPGGWSYGGPTQGQSSSQFSADSLWGVPVVVTSNIPLGTALVGNFQLGGALFRRQGITVEATNSHSTWFADNITALRAEERVALAVYRPSAFTAVIGLN